MAMLKYYKMLTDEQPDSVLIEVAKKIKQSGMKCVDLNSADVTETATGRLVGTMFEFIFKGNILQLLKAERIIDKLNS